MPPKPSLLPYLALFIGIVALSFSALFVRWAGAPGPVMGFLRLSMATVLLLPVFLRRRSHTPTRLQPAFLLLPLLGGVFTALDHAIWNTSLGMTKAANSTLLNNTAPLWVALFSWLVLKERLNSRFWVGLGFTLAGAGAVLGYDFFQHPALGWGDLLAVVSGVFYGGYYLITQRGRHYLDTVSYIWFVGLSASVTLLSISLAFGMPITGYPAHTYLAALGAAVVSQLGGYLAVGYALGHLPASVVSPTMIVQPVVTALLAIPLLGENLHMAQWVGGLAVLTGIYLVHKSREQAQEPAALTVDGVTEVI